MRKKSDTKKIANFHENEGVMCKLGNVFTRRKPLWIEVHFRVFADTVFYMFFWGVKKCKKTSKKVKKTWKKVKKTSKKVSKFDQIWGVFWDGFGGSFGRFWGRKPVRNRSETSNFDKNRSWAQISHKTGFRARKRRVGMRFWRKRVKILIGCLCKFALFRIPRFWD
jgi:hypothetical protein